MIQLPIDSIRDDVIDACRACGRAVVVAPTGSGKSTRIPGFLLDAGLSGSGKIVVLQPRRIAARLLARRVARERGCALGDEVGYQVRFENRTTARTKIVYETDGILMRSLQSDPELRGVAAIVFDEFHERHLYSDLMLGIARQLQDGARHDLRLVVMSATLDTGRLESFLAPCRTLRAAGRAFPVETRYAGPERGDAQTPVWERAARETGRLLEELSDGHVLVFMPGRHEIRGTLDALRGVRAARDCDALPLYGDLPPSEQDRAVDESPRRKIIVATNVAETSLTIDGVAAVVDSGLARVARFDLARGIDTLLIEKISAASADQRAGRAGRTRPGVALRLWSEAEHRRRAANEEPEIDRVDLSETLLLLKCLGVEDVAAFPWVTPPPQGRIESASGFLTDIGALDGAGRVTALGRRLAAFPVHPRIGRLLLAGERHGCVAMACLVAALLQNRPILVRTRDRAVLERQRELVDGRDDSDLLLAIAALARAERCGFRLDALEPLGIHAAAAREAAASWEQLQRIAESEGLDLRRSDAVDAEALHRCVLAGFPDRVARRLGGGTSANCAVVHGRRGRVSDATLLGAHPLFVATGIGEIGTGAGALSTRLETLVAIRAEWLKEEFPDAFRDEEHVFFDPAGKRVSAERRTRYHDLVIEAVACPVTDDEKAADLLARQVVAKTLTLKQWDTRVEQWLLRIDAVAHYCPELGISAVTAEDRLALIARVCHGARSYRDIKDRPVWPALKRWLGAGQASAVEAYAPERVTLSNGRTPKVMYDDPRRPYISLRIQHLYDVTRVPSLCMGRVTPLVHLLAPNDRPAQITADLAGFWADGYERAKKELRGRYPKHEWR